MQAKFGVAKMVFVKHFSEDSRRRSLTASLVFSIFATLVSLTAIGWGIYTYFVSMALLKIVGGPVAGAIPYVMASVGIVNLVVATRSIRVAVVARRVALGQVAKSVFKIAFNVAALLIPVLVVDVVCGVVLLCSAALAQLTSSSSLYAACFDYYGDAASKRDLDNVQSHLQCCGVQSPTNWAMLNPRSVTDRQTPTSISLPMSCCPLPHVVVDDCQYSSKMVPGTVAHSVVYSYHHGCMDQAVQFLDSQHFWSAGVVFAMALTMLLVAVCQRLAQTSARAAIESGDSGGPAPAWLFRDPRSNPRITSTEKRPPSSSLWRDESSGWPRPRDPFEPGPSKPKSGYRRFANAEDNEGSSDSEEVTGSQQSGQPPTSLPPPHQIRPIKHIRLPDSEGASTKEEVYEIYSTSGTPAYYGPDGLPLNQDQVQVLKPPAKDASAGSSPAKRTQSATLSGEQRSSEDQDSARKLEQSEGGSRKKNKFSLARVFSRVVRKSRSGGRRKLLDERSMSRHTSRSELALKESRNLEERSRLLRPSWTSQRNFQHETSLKASDEEHSHRRSRRATPGGVHRMRISEAENEGQKAGAGACIRQIRCLDGKANQTACQAIFPSPSTYRTSSDMPTELSVTPVPSSDEEYAMGAICRSPSPSKTSTCSEWSSRESSPERKQPLFRQAASQTTFDSSTATTTSKLISTQNATVTAPEAAIPLYGVLTEERRGVCLTIEEVPKVISLSFVITDERMPVEVPRRRTSESARDKTLSQLTMNFLRHSSSALQSTEGRTGTICLSQLTNSSERSVSVCALDESGEVFLSTEPKRLRLEDGSTGKVDRGVPNDSSAEEGLLSDSVDGSWREDSATEFPERLPTDTPEPPKKDFLETDFYPLLAPVDKSDDFGFFDPFNKKAVDAGFQDDGSSNGRQRTFSFDEEYRVDSCFVTRSHPGLIEQEVSFSDLSKVISRSNFLELGCAFVLNGSRDDFEFCHETTPFAISQKSDSLKCGMDEIGSVNFFGNPNVASLAPPSPPPQMLGDNQLNFICGLKDDVSSWFALDAQRGQENSRKLSEKSGTVQDCIMESSKQLVIAVPNHNSIQLLYKGGTKPRESSEILLGENNAASIWRSEKDATQSEKADAENSIGLSVLNERNLTDKLASQADLNVQKIKSLEKTLSSFSPVPTKDSRQKCFGSPSKASLQSKFRKLQCSHKRSSQKSLTALIKGKTGKQDTPLSSGNSIHDRINRHSVAPAIASLGIVGLDQSTNVKTRAEKDSLTVICQRPRSSLREKATCCSTGSKHHSTDALFKRQNKIHSARSSNVQIVPTNLKEVFCAASAPVCPKALSAVPLSDSHPCDTGMSKVMSNTESAQHTFQSADKERIGTCSTSTNIPSNRRDSTSKTEFTRALATESRGIRGSRLSKQNSIISAGTSTENREGKIVNEEQIATIDEMPKNHQKETCNLHGRVPSKLLETEGRMGGDEISDLKMKKRTSREVPANQCHNEPSERFGVRQVEKDDLIARSLITGTQSHHASKDKISVCSDIAETRSASDDSAVPNQQRNSNPKTNIPCLYLPDSSSTDTANFPLPQLETAHSGNKMKISDDHGGKSSDATSSLPGGNNTLASESDEKLELDANNSNEPLKFVPSSPKSIQSVTSGEDHERVAEDPPVAGMKESSDLQVEQATFDLQKRSEHETNSLKKSNFESQCEEPTHESRKNIRSENTSERQGNENTLGSSVQNTCDNRTELGNRLHLPISRFPHQLVNFQDCWNSYAGERPPPTEGEFFSENERKWNSFSFDSAVCEVLVTDENTVVRSRHPIPRCNAVLDMDWALSSPGEDTDCDALTNKIKLPLVPFLEFLLNLDPSSVDPRILEKILQELKNQLDRGATDTESQSPCRVTDPNRENAIRTTTNDADADTLDRRKGAFVRSSRDASRAPEEFEYDFSKVVGGASSTYRLSKGTNMSDIGISLSQFTTHIFDRDSESNSSNSSSSSYKCGNCDCWVNAQTTAEDSSYRNTSQQPKKRKNQKETTERQLSGGQASIQSNSSHFDSAASECADFLRTSDFESAESTSSTSTITGTSEACPCAPERNSRRRETFHREDSEKS